MLLLLDSWKYLTGLNSLIFLVCCTCIKGMVEIVLLLPSYRCEFVISCYIKVILLL